MGRSSNLDNFQSRLNRKRANSGHALIEFTFAFPFLITIFTGVWNLGNCTTEYLTITQIVREGVRYGGNLAELESGSFTDVGGTSTVNPQCPGGPIDAVCNDHVLLQDRIRKLIKLQGLNPADFSIRSELPVASSTNRNLSVEISSSTPSLLSLMGATSFSWQLDGPFLYDRFPSP